MRSPMSIAARAAYAPRSRPTCGQGATIGCTNPPRRPRRSWRASTANGSPFGPKRRRPSAPLELGFALLQEGGDAFGEILGTAGFLLRAAFGVELLLVGIHRAVPIKTADEAEGRC